MVPFGEVNYGWPGLPSFSTDLQCPQAARAHESTFLSALRALTNYTSNVRIGTSGWHYKHWRGPFYPADLPTADMLSFYVHHFDTVEINNSFYRLPTLTALENWREGTPKGFCFAVKASRYLTHMKKLKEPEAGLANFLPAVKTLGEKLGPILFQL